MQKVLTCYKVEDFLLYAAAWKKGTTVTDIPDLIKQHASKLCDEFIQKEILQRLDEDNCRAPIDKLMSNLSGVEDRKDPNVEEFFYLASRLNNAKLVVSIANLAAKGKVLSVKADISNS